jgi:hypothetical protein
MQEFTCSYRTGDGRKSGSHPKEKVKAVSAEGAARIYAERYPSDDPRIEVSSTPLGDAPLIQEVYVPVSKARREAAATAAAAARVESLQKLHSSVESADGNLAGLPYIELSALVENLKDFPSMRDKISPEECAVREELYKVAFFDRNLQAGLQTKQAELQTELQTKLQAKQARHTELQTKQAALQVELLRDLKSAFTDLQSGKSESGAGKSNLARNVGMMGGIAALQKLNQIEENTEDISEGFGFD